MTRLGVSFDGFLPFQEALELAKRAVAAGAGSLWMAEHMGYREALVSCMSFVMATERALVVPTAISPYVAHPTPTAMAMATLAEAGPGRAAIAVGIGNPLFLKESGVEVAKPLTMVREFVECMQALWSGAAAEYQGKMFRLAGARMAFVPSSPVLVYIAAMRDQMLRLSGEIADGVVLSAGLSAGFCKRSFDVAADGARAAGRDPAALRRAAYIYAAISADGREAVDLVREKLAFLMRNKYLAENLAHSGLRIDQEAIIAAISRRDFAAAAKLVPDDAVEAFAVAGTPRHCRDRLATYVEMGVAEPVLAILGTPAHKALALDLVREFARG